MSIPRLVIPSLLALGLAAQTPGPAAEGAKKKAQDPAAAAEAPRKDAPAPDAAEPKPYDKVVTAEFKTQEGLFKVHQHKTRLYFEIPKEQLGREFLMVATAAQVPVHVDHAGQELAEEVVRFVLRDNKVYFQSVSHDLVSGPDSAIAPAVAASQRETILAAFNVEAFAKDGSPVVDLSRLFTTEVGAFSARGLFNGQALDPARSYVDRVRTFKGSLRVDAVQTYSRSPFPPGMPPIPGLVPPPPQSASVVTAYNLVELPAQPMKPRFLDDRVGFFTVGRIDYGSPEHEAKVDHLITRWRLEKKDPGAALSEPVKPIVWYIDQATPAQWVPFIKKGVEAWNAAFEAAGFKHAVQARTFPTKEEDPEFDPEDIRYSIIRWVPSPVENAYGPCIADPRSGEILNADIIMYHNILKLQRDWYFTQVGSVDPRAAKLPLPDALMGELLAFVVSHECGHSLGFPHNMKASSTYPIEKLRDPAWLKEMGHTPSIMDYCRFNYLAQPEDHLDPELLRPRIGPYDVFAVKWGYTVLDAATPEAEKPALEALVREQDTRPWLRFSTPRSQGSDPGENTEAVGDADAVRATTLGTRSLQRVLAMLPAAVDKPGDSDETLEHLYRQVWGQWHLELDHVAVLVGGFDSQNKHQGQKGEVFTPVPAARQREAVRFLDENLFRTPQWLLEPGILSRLAPDTGTRLLLVTQRRVLRTLLDRARTERLQEQETLLGDKAYRLADLLAQLRTGIFTELEGRAARIAPQRRNLQRVYLDLLNDRLNLPVPGVPPAFAAFMVTVSPLPDDTPGAIRAELRALLALTARPAGDKATKVHLEYLRDRIARILDPKLAPAGVSTFSSSIQRSVDAEGCWPAHEMP